MQRWQSGGHPMENERLEKIETRMTVLETRVAVNAVHQANTADRLTGIEDTLKWLVRLVLGGLILGLMSYVLQGGFLA